MTNDRGKLLSRRKFGMGLAALSLSSPALLRAQETSPVDETSVDHVTNSFVSQSWHGYFDNLRKGAILVDTRGRVLHYWSEDQSTYMIFPTSVPLTEQLTRRGRTQIIQKVDGPEWRPTPNMLRRDPELPSYVGPGPENPLGTHALYLSWQFYRIHGTNDTRKIGRQSSNGCIGLYNEDIEVLFSHAKVGTQVLLI